MIPGRTSPERSAVSSGHSTRRRGRRPCLDAHPGPFQAVLVEPEQFAEVSPDRLDADQGRCRKCGEQFLSPAESGADGQIASSSSRTYGGQGVASNRISRVSQTQLLLVETGALPAGPTCCPAESLAGSTPRVEPSIPRERPNGGAERIDMVTNIALTSSRSRGVRPLQHQDGAPRKPDFSGPRSTGRDDVAAVAAPVRAAWQGHAVAAQDGRILPAAAREFGFRIGGTRIGEYVTSRVEAAPGRDARRVGRFPAQDDRLAGRYCAVSSPSRSPSPAGRAGRTDSSAWVYGWPAPARSPRLRPQLDDPAQVHTAATRSAMFHARPRSW